MSINDKVVVIQKVIALVCDSIPVVFTIIKEIITMIKELKTV